MRTGAAVMSSGKSPKFLGEVLELISGQGVDSVLRKVAILDVQYVHKMLSEVSTLKCR